MGCGASKTAVVAPETAPTKAPEAEALVSSSTTSLTGNRQNVKVRQRKHQSTNALRSSSTSSISSELQAVQSEVASIGSRNISATSGKSKNSADSGDSGIAIGDDYNTEKSNQIPQEAITQDDSSVGVPSRSNSGNKQDGPNGIRHVKFAESLINELPDSPSILKRPASRGGMAFDVVLEDNQEAPHMPTFSSNSKRKKRLTYQELQDKQRIVEKRKKASS